MTFSEWTRRTDSHVVDTAAGDNYEALPLNSKYCIDSAIERFIKFRKANVSESLRVKNLEKFMCEVSKLLGCLPDFGDSLPDGGNAHVIEKLNKLLGNVR